MEVEHNATAQEKENESRKWDEKNKRACFARQKYARNVLNIAMFGRKEE